MTKDVSLIAAAHLEDGEAQDIIQDSLDFVRTHLDMEVAYLSEFIGDDLVFRRVSAPGLEHMIKVDDTMPLEHVYCRHILDGRLPELIPDTALEPFAQNIPITNAVPVGAHVSVPIRRRDGSVYGMFCCLSRAPRPSLNPRDLETMRAFASLSSDRIDTELTRAEEQRSRREIFAGILQAKSFDMLFQPIFDGARMQPSGFEALCRFRGEPYRSPDVWFSEAATVDLLADLEIRVIETALEALRDLPDDLYVSVNASPQTVESGRLYPVLCAVSPERTVLEVTEHAKVDCYTTLQREVDRLRFAGVRIAIDDAGAGYAGLQHIVQLSVDIIKLDMSLTSGIDQDIVKRSLTAAIVGFASEIGGKVVAEGVETVEEFQTLMDLGVPLMQGYHLGRPMPLAQACAFCTPDRQAPRSA